MTSSEVVILGLLYEKDCYGYEIEEIVNERGIREWTDIGFSSIYSILNKMEKSKLISSRYDKKFGSPRRKVYFINDETKPIFIKEVKRMLSAPKVVFSEFDIGMSYSHLLAGGEFEDCVTEHMKKLEARRNRIQEKFKGNVNVEKYYHVKALFTRAFHLISAEIDWIKDQLNKPAN